MLLSDISIKRPVFASVMALLLIVFGIVSFQRLALREYPDIDPPIVSIDTTYPGAAANVVETQITEILEERIAGVEGIVLVSSVSEDGRSRITIEFTASSNVGEAANDIRDRVAGVIDNLPEEAEPPEIQKVDSNDDVIMWLNLISDRMTVPELTDYADRNLVDQFSILDGVARVRVGGAQSYAMRIWLDRGALAARSLTVSDIEAALRAENIELPAGSIESEKTQFTVRVKRVFREAEDFQKLVIARGEDEHLIRLGDIARVEKGTVEDRTFFRGNGVPMVGIGVIKQSQANTLSVARAVKKQKQRLNLSLPEGMELVQSYDSSVFIEGAVKEVYKTLFIAIALVILVIYLFLGSWRATLVPAITVPVSLVATFIVLLILGFSINLLTLLALVLAIGLVVDDAIVVLENIYRRMDEKKETPLVAAYKGARQVAFAVISTTLVLISVFVPISFLQGDIGRLFSEFALTIAAAVGFSSLVALSFSPMLASKLLGPKDARNRITEKIDQSFRLLQKHYTYYYKKAIIRPMLIIAIYSALLVVAMLLIKFLPYEHAPKEDRGAFFVLVNGPEGASYTYMQEYMDEIERRLMPLIKNEEATRLLVRAPRGFGNIESFNSGIVIVVLNDWSERRSAWTIINEIRGALSDLPGVRAFPIMRQGISSRVSKPVQFVIGGGTYSELLGWKNILLEKINDDNPGLVGIDWDYKETKPQLEVKIDYQRAAELGVSINNIGRTLETMLGSRRVSDYIDRGKAYDVILEGERAQQDTPGSLQNLYVRSSNSGELIPLSNLVIINERATSPQLNRYNRVRALTLEANLADGYSLGAALDYLDKMVAEHLPDNVIVDYKGQSRDYKYAGGSIIFIFILGILVVYLVLAAQFESYIHPFIIMLTVPLAIVGGLLGLWIMGASLNIYSQIGLVILVGLAAKNGILIVEFANQLRDAGQRFETALLQAVKVRLRPIVMTGLTTAAGAIPLILSFGAGAETRRVIGVTVFSGVIVATFFTLFVVPVSYSLFARKTGSPNDRARQLEKEMSEKATPLKKSL